MNGIIKLEVDLDFNGGSVPAATAVVQPMDEGDLIIGIRPYQSHPDSEYAIVGIEVIDGGVRVRIMDGDGAYIADPVEVKR